MNKKSALIKDLKFFGLFEKANEIYSELGENAVLSYIKSSHRLLSKVYHPDLNPSYMDKALITQQKLNRFSETISSMDDCEIIELFKQTPKKHKKGKRNSLSLKTNLACKRYSEIFLRWRDMM